MRKDLRTRNVFGFFTFYSFITQIYLYMSFANAFPKKKKNSFSINFTTAMSGLGKPFTMGLMLLLWTLSGHCGGSAARGTRSDLRASRQYPAGANGHMDRDSRDHSNTETATRSTARKEAPTVPRDLRNLRTERADTNIEMSMRDIRKKEKFLKHLTGPLYFSPKCKKHVYRLYHNTRDCTIPAYFKRCARLLTRLAGSPQCTG